MKIKSLRMVKKEHDKIKCLEDGKSGHRKNFRWYLD